MMVSRELLFACLNSLKYDYLPKLKFDGSDSDLDLFELRAQRGLDPFSGMENHTAPIISFNRSVRICGDTQ